MLQMKMVHVLLNLSSLFVTAALLPVEFVHQTAAFPRPPPIFRSPTRDSGKRSKAIVPRRYSRLSPTSLRILSMFFLRGFFVLWTRSGMIGGWLLHSTRGGQERQSADGPSRWSLAWWASRHDGERSFSMSHHTGKG